MSGGSYVLSLTSSCTAKSVAVRLRTLFTALHGMQTRSCDENSVRPSVCPSNAWIVTKRKKNVFKFLYHTKDLE